MSFTATPYYQVVPATCCVHNHPHSGCAASQSIVNPASPAFTTITMYTPHHSPVYTISPLPGVSPLPASFMVASPRSTDGYYPPSPVVPGLLLATVFITPLLAFDQSLCYGKIHYDVLKDPGNARVSKLYGQSAPITNEQKRSLVVEGALHTRFRIVFDHPALTRTIELHATPTVGDFFAQLRSYFYEPVWDGEKYDLQKDPNHFSEAVKAQKKRCDATFDPDVAWRQGMKRVDILGKKTKFRGIYLDSSSTSDYLTLRVVFGR